MEHGPGALEGLDVSGAGDLDPTTATATPWSRTTAVIVTHNSAAVIEPCLRSVARCHKVVVVDNASDDETRDIVRRCLPRAEVIENPIGLGFGSASNQGLGRVETEFAIHPNPDAVMMEGALEALVAAADRFPDGGLFGPRITSPAGKIETSFDVVLHLRRRELPRDRDGEPLASGPICTGFLSGATLFYRMSVLRELGGFDPAFFLYHEDMDLCARFFESRYSSIHVPEAEVIHIGGGSIRSDLFAHWEKFYHLAWSRLYYECKYRGRGAAAALGWSNVLRFFGKAVLYALTLNGSKMVRDLARGTGSLAYLLHIQASKTVKRARPESAT